MEKVHLSLQALTCLKNDFKIDVKPLDKGLTKHFDAAMISLYPVEFL